MKILVTGGTGFVGGRVVRLLVSADHEVRCLVRSMKPAPILKQMGVEPIPGNLTDRASLVAAMKGCDWVINAAAAYDFWTPDSGVYQRVNVGGTQNVMEAALDAGVAKVIHVSTMVVYGKPATSPVTEQTPVSSVRFSEYACTKYEGEQIAWNLYQTRGLPLVIVYPGAVLGAEDSKATGQYIRRLLQGKLPATIFTNSTFPFVYVNDVAEAIFGAAKKENNLGEKYLLAGENLTFGQINSIIAELSGVHLPRLSMPDAMALGTAWFLTALSRITGKPPAWGMSLDQIKTMKNAPVADGGKAVRELGIRYTPIRQALKEAIESYQTGSCRTSSL